MRHPKNTNHSLVFLVLAVGAASFSMLQSLLAPVLPTLQRDLGTSAGAVTWVLIAWLISAAITTPILGKMGDNLGKVNALSIALIAIGIGSFVAAIAPNIEMVVLGRLIQGFGGAVFPLSFGIIRDDFPSERVAPAVGSLSAVISVGGGAGMLFAGPVVELLGWRWLFWLPMIIVGVAALMVRRIIPESGVRPGGEINWHAAALLAGCLTALLLPLTQGPAWGWSSPAVLGLLGAAAVLGATWVTVEVRSTNPLIDMQMMRLPVIWRGNLLALLMGACGFAFWVSVPQLIQTPRATGYGLGAGVNEAAWIMLPYLLAMALGGFLSGRLAAWLTFKSQLSIAGVLVASAFMGLAFRHAALSQLSVSSAILGFGTGLAYAGITSILVRSVLSTQTGTAIGVNTNIRTIGGALGTAAMAAVLTSSNDVGGYPSEGAYVVGFLVFATIAFAAALVARLTPVGPEAPASPTVVTTEIHTDKEAPTDSFAKAGSPTSVGSLSPAELGNRRSKRTPGKPLEITSPRLIDI